MDEIVVRLRCTNLPGRAACGRTAVRLGIQRGTEVVEDVLADGDVTFDAFLRVQLNDTTGKPNFLGPYAQGTPQERFLYLCWGERHGSAWNGFRRAKVHLNHLSWDDVARHLAGGKPLEADLNMTDAKGDPLCASVKSTHVHWRA